MYFVSSPPTSRAALKRKLCLCFGAIILFLLALLLLLPAARDSGEALCNRFFDLSEARNAYRYTRFTPTDGAAPTLALMLLAVCAVLLGAALLLSRSRPMALTLAVLAAGLQIYFGVSLPAWINLPLFGLLGTVCLADPRNPRMVLAHAGGLALIAAVVFLLAPEVHEATELASEQVRDHLSLAEPWTATLTETPPDVLETRHENRVTLGSGTQEGQNSRDYRLMTVKQLDISRPAWVDYVRIIVLSLLILLLLTAPFLPFLWLNSRRKKVQALRADFASEDHAVAIRALFRHVIAYLDLAGISAEHQPFTQWGDALVRPFSSAYAAQFVECARIWQETVYSDHAPNEEQHQAMLSLLAETERLIYEPASAAAKFRMRYLVCLHE